MRTGGNGRVIVVSSGAAAIAEPYGGWYSVTKAAVERLGEALRMELAHSASRSPYWHPAGPSPRSSNPRPESATPSPATTAIATTCSSG